MFADTLTLTVNGAAKVLVRINQDAYSSEYLLRDTLGQYSLKLRNSTYSDKTRSGTKVDRHSAEFIQTINPVAPSLISTRRKAYAQFECDTIDTVVDPVKHTAALMAFLSEANLTKLANFES